MLTSCGNCLLLCDCPLLCAHSRAPLDIRLLWGLPCCINMPVGTSTSSHTSAATFGSGTDTAHPGTLALANNLTCLFYFDFSVFSSSWVYFQFSCLLVFFFCAVALYSFNLPSPPLIQSNTEIQAHTKTQVQAQVLQCADISHGPIGYVKPLKPLITAGCLFFSVWRKEEMIQEGLIP